MESKMQEHFKELLKKQEDRLQGIVDSMKQNDTGENQWNYTPELSSYDNHPAEMGTQVYQQEFNNAQVIHQIHLLKDVKDALRRIENGKYGSCAFCGKEIGKERLEAIPYARLCIDCEESKAVTPGFLKSERPNEERVIDIHLGRKYLNQREDDEYEGMDQFNDLMKYGSSDTPQDLGGYHDYDEFYTNESDLQGVVDDVDRISNKDYKKQLPD